MTEPGLTGVEPRVPEAVIPPKPRPFILSLLCTGGMVYFFLMSVLTGAGLFFSGDIARIMNQYLPESGITGTESLLFFGLAFGLHATSLAGLFLVWKLRRRGYFLLGLSCLAITVFQLFNPGAAVGPTALYIAFILVIGLFYPRMH